MVDTRRNTGFAKWTPCPVLACVVLPAFLLGCAPLTPASTCQSDADCGDNFQCDVVRRYCVPVVIAASDASLHDVDSEIRDAGSGRDSGGSRDSGGNRDLGREPDSSGDADAGGHPDSGGTSDSGSDAALDAGSDAGGQAEWQLVDVGTSESLHAIAGFSSASICAVGDNGVAVRHDGTTWTRLDRSGGPHIRGLVAVGGYFFEVGLAGEGAIATQTASAWTDVSFSMLAPGVDFHGIAGCT